MSRVYVVMIQSLIIVFGLLLSSCQNSSSDSIRRRDAVVEHNRIPGASAGDFDNDVDNYSYMDDVQYSSKQGDLTINAGDRVFFGLASYELDSEAQEVLLRQYKWLKHNPDIVVTVAGHCDERGTPDFNLALGERRAYSVKSFLVELGIDGDRITVISYGKQRPVVTGDSEEVHAKNRRVEMIVAE